MQAQPDGSPTVRASKAADSAEAEKHVMLADFFFSSRRRHTRFDCDWSSDVCSSDLGPTDGTTPPRSISRADVIDAAARVITRRGDHRMRWAAIAYEAGNAQAVMASQDRKSTRLNSSHSQISYAVFCLKKKKKNNRSCLVIKKRCNSRSCAD